MLAARNEQKPYSFKKIVPKYQIGDRVVTNNCRLGTVVRLDRDELGDYIVVHLDVCSGDYAYDASDLEKVN